MAQLDAAFSLLLLIPVAGVVLMIVFCSKPSDSDNARGPASWHKRAREGSRKFYRVGGTFSPVLSHHRAYRSVHGGSIA